MYFIFQLYIDHIFKEINLTLMQHMDIIVNDKVLHMYIYFVFNTLIFIYNVCYCIIPY